MRVSVVIVPNAKHARVERDGEDSYRVHVPAPATEGKANALLIAMLAEYFGVPKSLVTIKRGTHARTKIVTVGRARK
jgi:uncharacterized protein